MRATPVDAPRSDAAHAAEAATYAAQGAATPELSGKQAPATVAAAGGAGKRFVVRAALNGTRLKDGGRWAVAAECRRTQSSASAPSDSGSARRGAGKVAGRDGRHGGAAGERWRADAGHLPGRQRWVAPGRVKGGFAGEDAALDPSRRSNASQGVAGSALMAACPVWTRMWVTWFDPCPPDLKGGASRGRGCDGIGYSWVRTVERGELLDHRNGLDGCDATTIRCVRR